MNTPRVVVLATLFLGPLFAGSPLEAAGPKARHEFALGFGPSSTAPYLLFSWTSPRRVGAYLRMFPTLKDGHDVSANSTATDETAGEAGVTVRVLSWLTVGTGYGNYEKDVTRYGEPDFLLGIPVTLDEDTETHRGAAALAVFRMPSPSPRAAVSLSASVSPAGSGAAVGVIF